MDGLELAKLKDEILDFGIRVLNGHVNPNLFRNENGIPYKNHEEEIVYSHAIQRACEEIAAYGNNIVSTFEDSKDSFVCGQMTEKFLDDGGFVTQYNKEAKAMRNMNHGILQDKRLKDLTEKNLNLKNKTYWLPIAISIVSLGFAAYSLLKPSNNVPQEQYDTKMESIEKDIQQLRIDFKQENDKLKDRLYKAELLIAVYESDS